MLLRGIYTAASAMLVDQARMDVTSNNLANVNTAGFKQDQVVVESFRQMWLHALEGDGTPVQRQTHRPVGALGTGAEVVRSYTRFTPGALQHTGNSLDVAIVGDGFFTVDTPQGVRYTRNGRFTANEEGLLVTSSGDPVLGVNGPITIAGNTVDIDSDGQVFVNNQLVDRLRIVTFANNAGLIKHAGQYFEALEAAGLAQEATGVTVSQGDWEQSNVNVISEMVNMINATRSYEASQRAIQAQDEALGKVVNEVGRLA